MAWRNNQHRDEKMFHTNSDTHTHTHSAHNPERNNGWNEVINFHGTFLFCVSCASIFTFCFRFVLFHVVGPFPSRTLLLLLACVAFFLDSPHFSFVVLNIKIIETDFLLVVLIFSRSRSHAESDEKRFIRDMFVADVLLQADESRIHESGACAVKSIHVGRWH